MNRRIVILLSALLLGAPLFAQVDRSDVRRGNRRFRKGEFKEAEIDYRKAVLKDSLSIAGQYNLASTLYRAQDYDGALNALNSVAEVAPASEYAADYFYNQGDVSLRKRDYASAVESFRQSLLLRPGDMDAKENYVYAKKMLEDQNNQDQNNQDQNQDQNNQDRDNQDRDNQDQNNQDQNNQDRDNQNQNQDNQDSRSPDTGISPQQAQQMLQAIQAKEKETQDKVNKEKAALLKSRQKEKNW